MFNEQKIVQKTLSEKGLSPKSTRATLSPHLRSMPMSMTQSQQQFVNNAFAQEYNDLMMEMNQQEEQNGIAYL